MINGFRGSPGCRQLEPRWIDNLLHVFFPDRCLLCREVLPGAYGSPLCNSCLESYHPGGTLCPHCEGFYRGLAPCSCLTGNFPLHELFTLALYDQKWRRLIHDFKYKNRCSVARPLGKWLASEIVSQQYCFPDLVVPVPLHCRRENERGYNQSALLARYTAQALNVSCLHLLIKHRHTRTQTAISRLERFENVRGAFKSIKKLTPGGTVLLIDDVYSTGSTMKEAASILHDRGTRVYGAVIAYNPNLRDLQRSGFYAGLDQW